MADTQQVAVYVDAKTNLVSKYELIFVDGIEGEESSEIMGTAAALGCQVVGLHPGQDLSTALSIGAGSVRR